MDWFVASVIFFQAAAAAFTTHCHIETARNIQVNLLYMKSCWYARQKDSVRTANNLWSSLLIRRLSITSSKITSPAFESLTPLPRLRVPWIA
jgi:hypothetical protein